MLTLILFINSQPSQQSIAVNGVFVLAVNHQCLYCCYYKVYSNQLSFSLDQSVLQQIFY